MPDLLDVGRYMVVSDNDQPEFYGTQREAHSVAQELTDKGYYAYVHDLSSELATLQA